MKDSKRLYFSIATFSSMRITKHLLGHQTTCFCTMLEMRRRVALLPISAVSVAKQVKILSKLYCVFWNEEGGSLADFSASGKTGKTSCFWEN